MGEWKQQRPDWCPHTDCIFRRRVQDAICGGELPEPAPHDGDENTHRFCLNGAADDGGVFDLQVNRTDLGMLRWVFDALDSKKTSWLSRRTSRPDREKDQAHRQGWQDRGRHEFGPKVGGPPMDIVLSHHTGDLASGEK